MPTQLASGIAVVVRDTPLVKSGVFDGPTCYRSSLTLSKPHARTPLAAGIVVVVRDPPLVKRGVWSPAVGYTAGLVVPESTRRPRLTLSKLMLRRRTSSAARRRPSLTTSKLLLRRRTFLSPAASPSPASAASSASARYRPTVESIWHYFFIRWHKR